MAIIAVLAAVLTPLVAQYVDEARSVRALQEVKMIAQAIALHQRDTGKYPIYASAASGTTDADVLFGPGVGPTFNGTGWSSPASISLQTRLNSNYFSFPTTYGTGRVGYHGPYTVDLPSDPWGYTYVAEIGPAPETAAAAFVISAGPDGVISTNKQQSPGSFVVAGDDIVVRVK